MPPAAKGKAGIGCAEAVRDGAIILVPYRDRGSEACEVLSETPVSVFSDFVKEEEREREKRKHFFS